MTEISPKILKMVQHVLLKLWDPIGVGNIPEAEDEYDMYVPQICAEIVSDRSIEKIYKYLRYVEVDRMGLEGDEAHTRKIAEILAKIVD